MTTIKTAAILLLLVLTACGPVHAQKPRSGASQSAGSASVTAEAARQYILSLIASRNNGKGSFREWKGSKRRTDPDGTEIYNVSGLEAFGGADQYIMFYEDSYPTFVMECKGTACQRVLEAIRTGLPGTAPAGTYGYKVMNDAGPGKEKYAVTKDGKAFAIFSYDTGEGTGMFVINGKS